MRSNRTLTHKQARQCLQAAVEGRLDPVIQPALERHLAGCAACQQFASQLAALEEHLVNDLPAVWPKQAETDLQVASTLEKIHRQTRHTPMKNFLSSTARAFALGLGLLLIVSAQTRRIFVPKPSSAAARSSVA